MEQHIIELFIELIAQQTGLYIRSQDSTTFAQKIWSRIYSLKLPDPLTYYQLLKQESPQAQKEWQQLILLITTTESYFFRDKGQFNLLKNFIFPELINSRKQTKTLRIWSAGCSTGEEPYSIAVLLQTLLPEWNQWNITIIGTDINELALNKARKGIYSSWSFRLVEPELKQQYFTTHGNDWKINSKTHHSVTFFNLNIVKDDYSQKSYPQLTDLDLIICRNVFVYFEKQFIALVLKKFYDVLKPSGYLMTGHAELQGQETTQFKVRVFPESLVYQKEESWVNKPPEKVEKLTSNTDLVPRLKYPHKATNLVESRLAQSHCLVENPNSIALTLKGVKSSTPTVISAALHSNDQNFQSHQELCIAQDLFQEKAYWQAIQKAEKFLKTYPNHLEAHCLLAQTFANLGHYDRSIYYCNQALKLNAFAIMPHYILLHIAEEREDLGGAKHLAKRIIYLSPSSISAYLSLASIYEQEGDQLRAKKMYITALSLIKSLPENSAIEYFEGMNSSELSLFLEKKLVNNFKN